MDIPKLIFRRSWLYDSALTRSQEFKKPTEEKIELYFEKIQNEWKPWENKILEAISDTIKLPWNEREIVIYFTYGVVPFSDPLTINLVSDIHTITHELIHRIASEPENWDRLRENWEKVESKYKKESQKCRTHILVHAIHLKILKQFFDDSIIEMEMNTIKDPAYIKSWEIVKEVGYENIIKELTDFTL